HFRDLALPAIAVGQQAILVVVELLARFGRELEVRPFDDGVDGAGLLAEPAIDAFHHVDVVARRPPRAVVASRSRLDGDRLRRTNRLAQLAGDAALLAVRIAPQRVLAAEPWRERSLLEGIVERPLRLEEVLHAEEERGDEFREEKRSDYLSERCHSANPTFVWCVRRPKLLRLSRSQQLARLPPGTAMQDSANLRGSTKPPLHWDYPCRQHHHCVRLSAEMRCTGEVFPGSKLMQICSVSSGESGALIRPHRYEDRWSLQYSSLRRWVQEAHIPKEGRLRCRATWFSMRSRAWTNCQRRRGGRVSAASTTTSLGSRASSAFALSVRLTRALRPSVSEGIRAR